MAATNTRFFKLGSYTLILFAAVHATTFFRDISVMFQDEQGKLFYDLLQNYEFEVMGLKRTVMDSMHGFSVYLTIFTLYFGVQNLLVMKKVANGGGLGKLALVNVGFIAALAVVTAIFFIYPPLVLFCLSGVFFLLSYFKKEGLCLTI